MLRVNRLAAAIDMIAAGTRAPMAIAANAMPANQLGNMPWNSSGTIVLPSVPIGLVPAAMAMNPSSAIRARARLETGSALLFRLSTARVLAAGTPRVECGAVGGRRGRVPLERVAVAGRGDARDRVGVEEQRQRRAQGEGGVPQLPVGGQDHAGAAVGRELGLRRAEDLAPAAELRRDD